MKKIKVWSRH